MSKIKLILSILLHLQLSNWCSAQELSKQDWKYKPLDLKDAIKHMHKLTDDSTKISIKELNEDEYVAKVQFSQGMWIRNNWKLWKGGVLADHFKSQGISHPNDMSEIIFRTYSRDIKNIDWNTAELIENIIAINKANEEHEYRLKTDAEYRSKFESEKAAEKIKFFDELRKKYSVGKEIYTFLIYNCYNNNKVKAYGTVLEHDAERVRIKITKYEDISKEAGVLKCNGITDGSVWINLDRIYFLDEKPKPVIFIATPY